MKSGILWYDGSKLPLTEKIEAAAQRYKEKFGILPNVVFVNPEDYAPVSTEEMEVLPKRTILKGHLWLGRTGGVEVTHNATFTLVGSDEAGND